VRSPARRYTLAAILIFTPFLAGCGLANRQSAPSHPAPGAAGTPPEANAGERQGTVPASHQAGALDPSETARAAVERFAVAYVNWSYRTLAADQQRLAAWAVGGARASELQARQETARDRPLVRGRIFNAGSVITAAPVNGGDGSLWVCVTRERTGGSGEYESLPAAYHVTLATVARVAGGWAVSSWRPEL
jgi:hypothetical protein